MKQCKVEGCPLTRASDLMNLPEDAKPALCWRHQPELIRHRERERRRKEYEAWWAEKAEWRNRYFKRLDAQVYER